MITEWRIGTNIEGIGRGLILRYCSEIFLEGPSKTTKNISQDNLSTGRDLNPESSKYIAGVLTTRPRRTVRELDSKQWDKKDK
jgi:hypothetical protein